MAQTKERMHRLLAFILGLIECLVFSGCTYGWAAFVFILRQDGVYSHLCTEDEVEVEGFVQADLSNVIVYNSSGGQEYSNSTLGVYRTCSKQSEMLVLVFTVGNFALTGSTLLIGWMFDYCGTRVTRIFSMVLFVSGCLLLGFATVDVPILIFPGLCCFGVGGMILLVTNMQIGNYFDAARLTVVAIYNASFDTSSVVLLVLKTLREIGIKRLHCFIFLAALNATIVSISTFVVLPKFKVFPKDRSNKVKNNEKDNSQALETKDDDNDIKLGKLMLADEIGEDTKEGDGVTIESRENERMVKKAKEELPNASAKVKGLKHYLFSRVFIFALLWHGLIQLRFLYYVGSLNSFINDFTNSNAEKVSFITNVFSYCLMFGILCGPLEGILLHVEKNRLHRSNPSYYDQIKPAALPKAICSSLCLILSILVLVPIEGLFYVQFICLTIFRGFLYGLNSAFMFMAFPVEHFGLLFGVLMTVNSAIGALQFPLFKWSEGQNWVPPSMLMIVLTLLTFVHPIFLVVGEKFDTVLGRNNKAKSHVVIC